MIDKSKSFFKTKSLDEYCDYKHLDQTKFVYHELVYHSNAIEGILFDDVATFSDDNIQTYQLTDHTNAYEYVINNYKKQLTSKEILNIHSILMSNIFRLEKRGAAGEYRKNPVYIGPRYGLQQGGMQYKYIPKAMNILEKDIANFKCQARTRQKYNQDTIWKIHNDFEIIHPFNDGNGRTGRLLLNWLSLKYFNEFIIIDSKKKKGYYESINNNRQTYNDEHPEMKFYKNRIIKKSDINPIMQKLIFDDKNFKPLYDNL